MNHRRVMLFCLSTLISCVICGDIYFKRNVFCPDSQCSGVRYSSIVVSTCVHICVSNGTKCAGIKLENRTAGIADCTLQTCKGSEYFSPCTDKDKYYFRQKCADGVLDLGEKCYRFFTTRQTRADARIQCESISMTLAEPTYLEFKSIQTWVRVAKPAMGPAMLLGFDDPANNDKSLFLRNGTKITYLSPEWSPGEPNYSSESCVGVYPSGLMLDIVCSRAWTFLCQSDHT